MAIHLQKASMWKRISAFLFDGILLAILAVLFALIISEIVDYDGYMNRLENFYIKYGTQYHVDLKMSASAYDALDEEAKKNADAASEAINNDEEAVQAYEKLSSCRWAILIFGPLAAFLLWEFFLPLRLGNGQTLGKKIFGIAVMHTDFVKISGPMLFARAILGKYTIETMVPIFIIVLIFIGALGSVGLLVLLLLLLLQASVLIGTHTNSLIHDLLAKTVVVDFASQRIFDSRQAMIDYKKQQHEEAVSRTEA